MRVGGWLHRVGEWARVEGGGCCVRSKKKQEKGTE